MSGMPGTKRDRPLKLAVFISGTGRSLQNLIQLIGHGDLAAEICLVVSSKPSAGGLEFAEAAQIPCRVIKRSSFDAAEAHCHAMFQPCRDAEIDLVVMAGYIQHVLVPEDFESRVINIHPSLIPDFCGQGFYGMRVHEAVIEAGVDVTGCTVHFVDNEYDHGPIILQRQIDVLPKDTPQLLAQRVFAEECEALPEAIRLIADGRVGLVDGNVVVS